MQVLSGVSGSSGSSLDEYSDSWIPREPLFNIELISLYFTYLQSGVCWCAIKWFWKVRLRWRRWRSRNICKNWYKCYQINCENDSVILRNVARNNVILRLTPPSFWSSETQNKKDLVPSFLQTMENQSTETYKHKEKRPVWKTSFNSTIPLVDCISIFEP